jgi:hypothetical protein
VSAGRALESWKDFFGGGDTSDHGPALQNQYPFT